MSPLPSKAQILNFLSKKFQSHSDAFIVLISKEYSDNLEHYLILLYILN